MSKNQIVVLLLCLGVFFQACVVTASETALPTAVAITPTNTHLPTETPTLEPTPVPSLTPSETAEPPAFQFLVPAVEPSITATDPMVTALAVNSTITPAISAPSATFTPTEVTGKKLSRWQERRDDIRGKKT